MVIQANLVSYCKFKGQFAERVELCKTRSNLDAHFTSHIGSYEPVPHFLDPSIVFEMPTSPLEAECPKYSMIKIILDIGPNPHLLMKI